jgi:hypothetical protein
MKSSNVRGNVTSMYVESRPEACEPFVSVAFSMPSRY